jgi:hypothetical protein
MKRELCCICTEVADWGCVRSPNAGQLNHLCDRHFQALRGRNAVLASRYERLQKPYMYNNESTVRNNQETGNRSYTDHQSQFAE